jgi:hypothetical protein
MFSLCIPTINRFDKFLSKYIPKYLDNKLISEIIIVDENGKDVEKIKQLFPNIEKLKLYVNDKIHGPFLNKLKAGSLATNEWIALIDSDNFADENYFIKAKEYLDKNNINDKNVILAPCKAKPNFNYSHLASFIYKKGHFKNNLFNEKKERNSCYTNSEVLMNTGNYIINKYLIEKLDLSNEKNNILQSSSCDVIYLNTLLFEQLDLNLHVVDGMEYDHVVHDGSIYKKTSHIYKNFNKIIHKRYNNLK